MFLTTWVSTACPGPPSPSATSATPQRCCRAWPGRWRRGRCGGLQRGGAPSLRGAASPAPGAEGPRGFVPGGWPDCPEARPARGRHHPPTWAPSARRPAPLLRSAAQGCGWGAGGVRNGASMAWACLFAEVAHPQSESHANQVHDQQLGVDEGQRSRSSYGQGTSHVEPHPQNHDCDQGGLNSESQASPLALRRDLPAKRVTLHSSFALGGLRMMPSRVAPGTCSWSRVFTLPG